MLLVTGPFGCQPKCVAVSLSPFISGSFWASSGGLWVWKGFPHPPVTQLGTMQSSQSCQELTLPSPVGLSRLIFRQFTINSFGEKNQLKLPLWLLRTVDRKISPFKGWYSGTNPPGKGKNAAVSCQGSRQRVPNKPEMPGFCFHFALLTQPPVLSQG